MHTQNILCNVCLTNEDYLHTKHTQCMLLHMKSIVFIKWIYTPTLKGLCIHKTYVVNCMFLHMKILYSYIEKLMYTVHVYCMLLHMEVYFMHKMYVIYTPNTYERLVYTQNICNVRMLPYESPMCAQMYIMNTPT